MTAEAEVTATSESDEESEDEAVAVIQRRAQVVSFAAVPSPAALEPSPGAHAATHAVPRRRTERRSAAGECNICMDNANTHVLVPCGHKCVCSDCAELVRLQGACPICRTAIVWVCEVYEDHT